MSEAVLDNDERLALAKLAIEKNDFESALTKLKTIVADSSFPSEALLVLARLYATLSLFEKSRDCYQQFLSKVPDSVLGRFEFGMTLFDSGDIAPALEEWKGVLSEHQTHPPALFYSALAQARLGDITAAHAQLNLLFNAVPADNAYFQRGRELSMNLTSQTANNQTGGVNVTGLQEQIMLADETTH